MSSSIEDDDSTSSGISSIASAAPSSTISLSDPTPAPTTLVIAPSPTKDDLDDDEIFPPMTTPWTGPAACTWTYDANQLPKSGSDGLAAMLDLQPIPGAKSLSCYPDSMFDGGHTGVYSPGTCPHGWTTVSLRVDTRENRDDETTTAICCSSEYTLDGNLCKRSVSSVIAVPYTYNQTAQTYDAVSDSPTTLYGATIALYTIRALFKDRDKDALGLKDEDDIPGIEHHNQSLSMGARIGIGVGVGIFVLLAIGALAFWLLRRERKRTERKRPHELNTVSMRHTSAGPGGDFYAAADANHRRDRSRQTTEPPPAYEAATDSNSMTENDSRLSEDTATRDDEIRALQVKKEAIQRRIEELERSETQSQEDNRRN